MDHKARHFAVITTLLAATLPSCSSTPARPDNPLPATSAAAAADPCAISENLREKVKPLLDQGRLHRAVQVIHKADRLCPASAPTTSAFLVTALVELGKYSEARALAANIEANPSATSDARTAAASAKVKCDELDRIFPDPENAKLEMSRLFEQGRQAEQAHDPASLSIAEEKYVAAWMAWRPNGDALFAAGRVAKERGHIANAQRLFDRALADVERTENSNVVLDFPNGFTGTIQALVWSSDGHRLAVAHGREISILDQSWREVARFSGHTRPIQALAFSPDGQTLASGGEDHAIWLWNAHTGKVTRKLEGHTKPILSLDYAPDGKRIVSAAGENSFRFWEPNNGNLLETMDVAQSAEWAKYSPDGRTLALVIGNQLNLRDVATNKLLLEQEAYSAAFSPNGQWIAATDHNETLWLRNAKIPQKSSKFVATDAVARGFAFAPDSKTIAAVRNKTTVHILNATTGAVIHTLNGHTDYPRAVRFSPNGTILATGGSDRTVRLWDCATGKLIRVIEPHASSVNALAYAPNGRGLVSGSNDKTLRWWDLERGLLKPPFSEHSGPVKSLAFARDGQTFVSGSSDRTARIWDASNGHVLHTLEGHTETISSVAYAPNGKSLATASTDRSVRIWDIATGQKVQSISGNLLAGHSILFAPDGAAIAAASWDSTVRVWVIATGDLGRTFSGHSRPVMVIAAPLNGKSIASGSVDQTIRIWDVKTSETTHELKGHTNFVFALAYSPDGQSLASGSADNTVNLWNTTNGQLSHSWNEHFGAVLDVEFSPDGQRLVSSSEDGSLQWHRPDTKQTIATARALDGRDAGYIQVPSGHFDFLGSEACVVASLPVCRIGSVVWPFEACAERFYAPGLLRIVHSNDEIEVENVASLPCTLSNTQ